MSDIPENLVVRRAFAFDSGRYLRFAALPARWVSWWMGAVVEVGLVCKYRPRLLWSTYPIATAHLIGHSLHELTGLSWVAVLAKIYESVWAGKPIFALTDPAGDTAQVLRDVSLDATVPVDDAELIAEGLMKFRNGRARIASDEHVAEHSRPARTRMRALAKLLDEVSTEAAR